MSNKVFLIVLDGFGIGDNTIGNAVRLSKTPFLQSMMERFSSTTIRTSGVDVGLPGGLMGNSEVGHLNLGAGKIVHQNISRIDSEIVNGDFFTNGALQDSIRYVKSHGTAWHLIGLVSDGGVHSSLDHLYALLEAAKRESIGQVYLHALMDGRDTPPHSGLDYIRQVQQKMDEIGVGKIATISGRYWGMDRDKRWERVQRYYDLITKGKGLQFINAVEAIEDSYRRDITDEFIEPTIIVENNQPVSLIHDRDAVLFFNFRADRAREITWAMTEKSFNQFPHEPLNLHYTTMTQYDNNTTLPAMYAPVHHNNILGQVVSEAGLKQYRTAETEKYAHVTYFFNGGNETPFPLEDRKLIPSPKVATYDLRPEMSAPEVAKEAMIALDKDYSFMLLNFANPDMVGHTGVLPAAIKALETLDPLVEQLVNKAVSNDYSVIITSDHGNCEYMIDKDGGAHTAHTTNLVPLVLIMPDNSAPTLRQGKLADVAPTILQLMELPQPSEMDGKSLIIKKNTRKL